MITLKNLNELKDRAYKNAVAHGWHDENLSDEHFLCLVISELMEAVEADRKNRHASVKFFNHSIDYALRELHLTEQDFDNYFFNSYKENIKGSVEEELADACIRLLDLAGLRGIFIHGSVTFVVQDEKTFTENVYYIIAELTNPKYVSSKNINYALNQIQKLADMLKIDLLWHIEQKMKYNELRPYKHGGKKY